MGTVVWGEPHRQGATPGLFLVNSGEMLLLGWQTRSFHFMPNLSRIETDYTHRLKPPHGLQYLEHSSDGQTFTFGINSFRFFPELVTSLVPRSLSPRVVGSLSFSKTKFENSK